MKKKLEKLAKMLVTAEDEAVIFFVAGELEKIAQNLTDRYAEGVSDTLDELREVYGDGITETDLWAEYKGVKQ